MGKGDLKSKTLQSKLLTVEVTKGPNVGWTTSLTIDPTTNYSQIDSNKSIRFSVDGDNKMSIQDDGVIRINAIGVAQETANLVCPGSLKIGNSMAYNPGSGEVVTEEDAGTMTYIEGPNKSRLFMVMKTGTNPDVYTQVIIKENVY